MGFLLKFTGASCKIPEILYYMVENRLSGFIGLRVAAAPTLDEVAYRMNSIVDTENVLKHVGRIDFLTCFNRFFVSGPEFIRGSEN